MQQSPPIPNLDKTMNTPPDTMNEPYKIRVTQISIMPRDEPIFSEQCTTITILDEAAGEFLEVSQEGGKLRFDAEEWPHVRDAVEKMFKLCRNYD